MSYKIIVDSCGELPESYKKDEHFERVPLVLDIDGHHVVDDETFDQKDFLRRVSESPNCPKSSCPSPERYLEAYTCEADNVYAVTLSAELSGSYNSAELGKKLYLEEKGQKNIHVFNSCSAFNPLLLFLLFSGRTVSDHQIHLLSFDEIFCILIHLPVCQMREQIGDHQHRIPLVVADADIRPGSVHLHRHTVEGKRSGKPLVFLNASVIMCIQVCDLR